MLLTDELLFRYKRCRRRAFLDVYDSLTTVREEKDFLGILREERELHSQKALQYYNLEAEKPRLRGERDNKKLAAITTQLMSQGVNGIYQGVVSVDMPDKGGNSVTLMASPTLLVKQNIPSRWGNWSYFPVNASLGRNPKPEYKLILAFVVDILNRLQGVNITRGEIFLKDNLSPHPVDLGIWLPRARELVNECLEMLRNKEIPDVYISRQRCSFCPWYDGCYQVAKSSLNLSLIPGITPNRYQLLVSNGIRNLETLCQTPLSRLREIFAAEGEVAARIKQQAISILSGKPILRQPNLLPLPQSPVEIYFDIEADTRRNVDYLLGVLWVDNDNMSQQYHTFLAKSPEKEKSIWRDFLHFIQQYPHAPIFHYSEYEVETVKRLASFYNTPASQLQSLLSRLFDLHKILTHSFFLPVENYSLKSVANYLGFHWRNPKTGSNSYTRAPIGGDQCIVWYDQWLKTKDPFWLNCIKIYNEDDCLATYYLKKWIADFQTEWGF
ncbi:MAG: TM0106 family RecB-like putative nuclease [Geminocystis sp.]|nr:TM0106 family RecB-like putative nuclease [Geminocystis sp.]HIK38658.1 TM0106 family RecB-like putative nuclease [Geminocystis sp. M7585_C2015_104]MCS7147622.1 TM0106 family RecB-like putative nuclease [Geminocystis sp.]MCX8078025.1 TM0106 family RecB-like putative nuclease [Geminocystis sp.]MDW8115315.1 TM0106 family RecB-like putative nuclease [Geminocystis sp.]